MASKKHSAAEVSKADLHQDEEMHVTRTTPQGTQEAGVDKGHEQRDLKIRATLRWFAWLTGITVVIIAAMWVLLLALIGKERVQKTGTSSPLYVAEHTRREPELLPNPAQGKDQVLPWEHYRRYVEAESKQLKGVGLEHEDGRPALPRNAIEQVMREPVRPGAQAEADETRPSEETGGLGQYKAVLTQ
jgi:hypothetical protein